MTNKKTTKRALIASAVSLMLCFTMLLGTTYAWFTDSVTSTNNIIKSGNLDVELYYQNSETDDWVKVTDKTNVFKENTLWEPGHTEVVKLKVVNEGSLALKYQLGVNVADEVGSVNINGNPFKLSNFIKFGIVDGDKDFTRNNAIDAVSENATALNVAYASAVEKLDPSKESVVTMVVYMPENIGNDANYGKNETVPTIDLGINLYATQVEAEKDSFGADYDAGAYLPTVYNLTELLSALAQGGNIAVDATIDPITSAEVLGWGSSHTSELIMNENVTALNGGKYVFDQDSKYGLTILAGSKDQLFANADINANSQWSVLVSGGNNNVDINNVNIVASKGAGLYAYGGSKVVLENVNVNHQALDPSYATSTPWAATAVAAAQGVDMVINSGTYVGTTYGVYVYSSGGNLTINGGTFKAPTVVSADAWGSGAVANVVINGGNFDGKIASVNVGGGGKSTITINGGNFTNFANGAGSRLVIKGGTFDADPTSFVAKNYEVTDNGDGTWTVAPYKVSTADELITAIGEGKAVALSQNITVPAAAENNGSANAFSYTGDNDVVIDLNGYTIATATGNSVFRFKNQGTKNNTVNISNGTIVTDNSTWCSVIAAGDTAEITVNLDNVVINSNKNNSQTVKAFAGATINMTDCKVTCGLGGGVEACGGTVNILGDGNVFTQTISGGTTPYNENNFSASAGGTVNVYGGKFTATWACGVIMSSGGTLNVYDGEFTVTTASNPVIEAGIDGQWNVPVADGILNIYGGTFDNSATEEENDGIINVWDWIPTDEYSLIANISSDAVYGSVNNQYGGAIVNYD